MSSLNFGGDGPQGFDRSRALDVPVPRRGTPTPSPELTVPAFDISLHTHVEQIEPEWTALAASGSATVFQQATVIRAFYDAVRASGRGKPLIALAREASSGRQAAIFPLVLVRRGLLVWADLADCGIIDYGVPLFDPGLVHERNVAPLVRAVAARVPADALYFNKMPETVGRLANPFASLPGRARLPLSCWLLPLGSEYETVVRKAQGKKQRANIRRKTRRLHEDHDRRFTIAVGDDVTEDLCERFGAFYLAYLKTRGRGSEEAAEWWRHFYLPLARANRPGAQTWIASLSADGEAIAMDMGLLDARGPTPLLCGIAEGEWNRYSPGLQLLDEYFSWFGARGYELCDLSIGDYDYKKSYRANEVALYDIVIPKSLAGRLYAFSWPLKTAARRSPLLRKFLRRS